ncbi:MAG: HesA/MoeB/ThiF family protein [Pseudoruegeria sp.]
MNRYTRQIILPEVGEAGQHILRHARVLIVGAGGLGVPALQYLVGAGVGHITILDPDIVDESNLHRQVLYRMNDIGHPKAVVAAQYMAQLNPDISVSGVTALLTPNNASDLVQDCDLVLDCADSFAVSYTLSDFCLAENTPLITASALMFSGYVAGTCGSAPSLRAIFPDLPAQSGNCATNGVAGPVVGTIGTLQAQMAFNHLLGIGTPLGQMLRYDAHSLRMASFRFDLAPEPTEIAFPFISHLDITQDDFIVDLRAADEAPIVHPNAQRRVVDDFADPNQTLTTHQRIVLVCRSGLRSWRAATLLQKHWHGNIALIAMGDIET